MIEAQARPIVEQAAPIYRECVGDAFIGLIVQGSAVKGDYIPNCSDIDFMLFVDDDLLMKPGLLPLSISLEIQRGISAIDPSPFRYIQCHVFGRTLPPHYNGPIPGAYVLLNGILPVAEATNEELTRLARVRLSELDPLPRGVLASLLEHGSGRIENSIRGLETLVSPALYNVATLQYPQEALNIWATRREDVITRLQDDTLTEPIQQFYDAMRRYYPQEAAHETGLEIIKSGITFLEVVKAWFEKQ